MPLFFFCSGLFCAGAMKLNWFHFSTLKVAPILWVYVLWSMIVYFTSFTAWALIQGEEVDLIRPLTILWQPAQTLWFLYALGIIYILTKLLIKVPVVVGILLSVAAYSFSMHQADLMSASFPYKLARFLPFFYLGYLLREVMPVYVSSFRKYWPACMVAFFGLTYVAFESTYLNVGPLGLILGLLGILSVLCLFSEFEKFRWVRFLAWVGKRSIFVFVIHRIPLFYANEWLKNSGYVGDTTIELFIVVGVIGVSLLAGEILSRKVSKSFFLAPWVEQRKILNNA